MSAERAATQHSALSTQHWTWLAGGIIALAAGLAWGAPYRVDEETSLLPWLIGRGWVLYQDMADQHPPLLPWLLAAVKGDPGPPLHAVIIGLGALILALTYAVAARWAGPGAGLGALALAVVWLAAMDGTHLWYDGALAPVYLGVLWLLGMYSPTPQGRKINQKHEMFLVYFSSSRMASFWIGLLLGTGILLKQHAALAVPFVGLALYLGAKADWVRRLGVFALGLVLPISGAGFVLAAQGALPAAWYWIVTYNLSGEYARLAALSLSAGERPALAALYAPALAFILVLLIRTPHSALRTPHSVALLGLLLAATVPAWPRYGRFHLLAAVPLLAVAGAGAIADCGVRSADWRRRPFKIALLALVGVSALVGVGQTMQFVVVSAGVGGAETPYAGSIAPVRAWVDGQAPVGAPILIYGLDALIYRVLEREPPRPWVPQLPWMLTGDHTVQFWAGVEQARPPVALVSATGWAASPQPGPATGEGRLRATYHESTRFPVAIFRQAPPVEVVGLVRNER